jgi:hypothetical protein
VILEGEQVAATPTPFQLPVADPDHHDLTIILEQPRSDHATRGTDAGGSLVVSPRP